MSPREKSAWQKHLEKRARQNVRLVRMANRYLQDKEWSQLAPQNQLGVHLGLITLVHCSARLQDIRARARWMLHWMLGYLIEQGFTVEDASTENALDALEALMMAAAQSKEKQLGQLKFKNGELLYADDTPVPETWRTVYGHTWRFINALDKLA